MEMKFYAYAGLIASVLVSVSSSGRCQNGGGPQQTKSPVEDMVREAVGRGSRVIMKKVEYTDAADDGGQVRTKTYIEIDTRPSGAAGQDMLESQIQVEKSQREMIRAVKAIGYGQNELDERTGAIEGMGSELTTGLKSSSVEQSAVRGEAAGTGSRVTDADRTVQDANLLLKQIGTQVRSLSTSVQELHSRVGNVVEAVDSGGDKEDEAEEGEELAEDEEGSEGDEGIDAGGEETGGSGDDGAEE